MTGPMPKTSLRIALALGAFFVLALGIAACGSSGTSVPANAVAVVNGKPITQAEYTRWATITAKGAAQGAAVVIPDPPSYTKCIAALQKAAKPAKGQPKPSAVALKAQCKAQDTQLRQQTLSTLIQSAWIEGEAKNLGVSVTDAEVNKQLAQTKKQSFPTAKAFQKFLTQSGMTEADVVARVRIQALATKMTQKIQQGASPVTDAEIAAYYNQNKAQFSVPERRDIEVILTKTQARATAAKHAVTGGMSWKAAAKKYSTDAASRATGGVLRGVAKGQQDRALDLAAFSSKKGTVVGPVHGQFGWYIVRVTGIAAPNKTPLAQAKAQIRPLLAQQGQQQKMSAFIADFQKRWTKATTCRTGYVIPLCSNAPKPKTTSTAGGTVATSTQGGSTTSTKSSK
jgi:foldase protein PrsA